MPKVYGETEGGGTQALYLSHVPFEKLGLPALGDEPAPQLAQSIQHGVYKDFALWRLSAWRSSRRAVSE